MEEFEQGSIEIIAALVEAELGFLEVQVKHMALDAFHLGQTQLGVSPERLDTIDVRLRVGELVTAVIHAQMLGVADIDEAVIAAPAIAVDDAVQRYLAPNNLLQRGFPGVGHDLGGDPAVALEQAKDDGLAACTAPALATHATRAEVGLVHFDLTRPGAVPSAFQGQTLAQLDVDAVDRPQADAGKSGGIGSRQVQGEVTQDHSEIFLCDSGTAVVSVFSSHIRSLVHFTGGLTS